MPEVTLIHPCAARKCRNDATRVVTHDGRYPLKVCDKHIGWAKQRVLEIANS